MPSCPAATPSVSIQPPSKRRSSLAPAGTKAGSPVGAGNPGSSAKVATATPRARPRAAAMYVKPYQLLISPPVMTDMGPNHFLWEFCAPGTPGDRGGPPDRGLPCPGLYLESRTRYC